MSPPADLRQLVTPVILANELRMLRQDPRRQRLTIVLCEGTKDREVYKDKFKQEHIHLVAVGARVTTPRAEGGARAAVLATLRALASLPGVLAIVDADCDPLLNQTPPENVHFPDGNDLEIMLLCSPALAKVLGERGSEAKLQRHLESGTDPLTVLLREGVKIGRLRFLSRREGWRLRFEDLPMKKLFDRATLQLDEAELLRLICARTASNLTKPPTSEVLQAQLRTVADHDPCLLCCGHDLVELLSLALGGAFGSNTIPSEDLERDLRLAFAPAHFTPTQLYAALRRWEAAHPPFRLF